MDIYFVFELPSGVVTIYLVVFKFFKFYFASQSVNSITWSLVQRVSPTSWASSFSPCLHSHSSNQ